MSFDAKATLAKFTGAGKTAKELALIELEDCVSKSQINAEKTWNNNCHASGISGQEFRDGRDEIERIHKEMHKIVKEMGETK